LLPPFAIPILILPRFSQETVQGFIVLSIGPRDFKGGLLIKFGSLWHRCLRILNKGWVRPGGPFFWLQREKWTKEKWNRAESHWPNVVILTPVMQAEMDFQAPAEGWPRAWRGALPYYSDRSFSVDSRSEKIREVGKAVSETATQTPL
jgi:hypothetical protein